MVIRNCMKREVFSIRQAATIQQAANMFVRRHIGTLPVVDERNHLVGLLQLRDLLTLVMPDFIHLLENFDFLDDFGAVETKTPTPDVVSRQIGEVMGRAVSVEANCGLLRAFALLNHHRISDLPVVDRENVLIGIASRVDIGTALLANWYPKTEVYG